MNFRDFLLSKPTKPRVEFITEMCKKLDVVYATIAYWRKTNILPLYAQNYLINSEPNTQFDFTPFTKTQTRKNLA